MAVKSSYRGDGITRHETFTWQVGDEGDPKVAAIIEARTLEGMLNLIERECFEVMREADLPDYYGSWNFNEAGEWNNPPSIDNCLAGWKIANTHWPLAEAKGYNEDSPAGFAARILQQVIFIRRAWQSDSRKDHAALQAIHLGYLRAEMQIKRESEPAWATGSRQRETLSESRERGNMRRRASADIKHGGWQELANDIWASNHSLTKSSVARIIKQRLKLSDSINTIRQKLKKPDDAG